MAQKLLIVEDEAAIRQMLHFILEAEDFDVAHAENSSSAMQYITKNDVDLLLLDWMMPGNSGVEFCRRLKRDKTYQHIPIIMLTAKVEEDDMIEGLDAGADDYLTKPFSTKELIARIRAVLRRSSKAQADENLFTCDGLTLDVSSHRVMADKQLITVGPIEFKLLHYFMSHPDRVFSRAQLLDSVWGNDVYIEERTIDVHIRRLRKVLATVKYEHVIQTVRGTGYRFSDK